MTCNEKEMLMGYILTNLSTLENDVVTLKNNLLLGRCAVPDLNELLIAQIKVVSFLQFASAVMYILRLDINDFSVIQDLKKKYQVEFNCL